MQGIKFFIVSIIFSLAPVLWCEDEPLVLVKALKDQKGDAKEPLEEKKNKIIDEKHDTENMDKIQRERYEARISDKWFRGGYLIYDCEEGNFVCVNSISFERCGDEREENKKKSKVRLSCTPLKKFSSQEECFKEQYHQIENQKPKIFCMNPKYY